MDFVKQVPVDQTVVFIALTPFFQSNYVDVMLLELVQRLLKPVHFLAAFLRVLIQLIDVRSFLHTQTVVDFNMRSEKNNVNVFEVLVVFVNFILQNVTKFSQGQQIVVFVSDGHVHGENFFDRLVVGLLDCKIFTVDYKSEAIEALFQRLFAKL